MTSIPPDVDPSRVWRPNPGPQTQFLASSAYEVLYGGAAGGGKTDGLVMGAVRHVDKRGYNGIVFRRTFPELEGQVIPKSREWYHVIGGRYDSVKHYWRFPSESRVHFGHLQHEDDVYRYQGWEFQYIGFDELTHFTKRQYTYLLSRARSAHGIPIRIRASANPGGEGQEWVMERWAPWLRANDPAYKGLRAKPGEVLWYVNTPDGEQWVSKGTPGALSRVFIPASVRDNPHLMANDPAYVERLKGLDAVTRAQLLDGNWLIKPAAGLLFRRGWFRFVDAAPQRVAARVRRWDLASTENGGDWTIGVKMSRVFDRTYVLEDVVRVRQRPAGVEATVRATAEADGHEVAVALAEDPGQAGKAQSASYAKLLQGFNVRFERETGDKVTRAKPFSAQCEAGNVAMVRAPWNEPVLQCLEAFPEGQHDDDVDAGSGAFNALTQSGVLTYMAAVEKMAAGANS